MGLIDILNGMQNGPRGRQAGGTSGGGGMSPLTMALIGLLAYKAFKGSGHATAARALRRINRAEVWATFWAGCWAASLEPLPAAPT